MKDKIVEQVREKYHQRSEVGIKKYNTTLEGNNKDNYLKHLQEELMDATIYIEKLMSLNEEIKALCSIHKNNEDLGKAVRELVS